MVDSVSVTSGAVPFQNIQLIVRLKNLPPNSQVAFEGIAPSMLARGQGGDSFLDRGRMRRNGEPGAPEGALT